MAKVSFSRHTLPRSYGWLRTSEGKSRRVRILWDTGASHTFVHPRVLNDLAVTVDQNRGPSQLLTADEHSVACQGVVRNLQLATGKYRHRNDLVVANIGQDDVIVGTDQLKPAQGGFACERGFWKMTVNGEELIIPLIGEHSSNPQVQRIQGVKKTIKMLREYQPHLMMVQLWRQDEDDGEQSAEGEDFIRGLKQAAAADTASSLGKSAASSTRTHSARFRMKQEREQKLQAKIHREAENMHETSEHVRKQLLEEFADVFAEPTTLPPLRWENHEINFEEGAKMPQVRGLPRMSRAEIEATRDFLEDLLKRGWIEPSLASYGAPFFLVPKPNGGLRAVCDYRALNQVTRKIIPSLPLFENVMTELAGAKVFSGLDLTSMFYQIRVRPEDVEKTSFRTIFGLYNWKVTPMGTTGSVGTAMHTMNAMLQHVVTHDGETLAENPRKLPPLPPGQEAEGIQDDETWQSLRYHSALGNYANVFVDDILVYSQSIEEHIRHLRQICSTLRQHKLYLNPKKCEICKVELTYLGNRVGKYGIRPTPERTEALLKWPTPVNVTELQSFLGLIGFIRRYVADLAQIASPLHKLLGKNVPWEWGPEQEAAFEKLKRRCSSIPVLAIPDGSSELVIRCDASKLAMGAALYQRDAEGYLQPVEFKSKAFAMPQQKLPAHEREALALLYALKSFRPYILHRRFEVQTDNSALAQIFTSKDLSDLYARWYYKIAQYPGLVLKHRPGRKMYEADSLSRRRASPEDDATPFEVEPGELFSLCADSSAFATSVEPEQLQGFRERWPELYETDPDFSEIWQNGGDSRWEYMVHKGLLYKNGEAGARLCVPREAQEDRNEILKMVHDHPTAGHQGKHRTAALAMANFYWSGMRSDVNRYVRSCLRCQSAKENRQARLGEPTALTVPHNAWDVVHLDWITGLPKSPDGSDAILVMIDSLTGMLHLAACKKEDDSRKTAEHFIHNVIRLHGLPQTVISDRDIRLRAHFWRALNQRLGVNLRFTTAHHPQTNGKCERANAVVTEVLRCVCSWAGKDWAKQLDMAEFVINNSASGVTGLSPFMANTARAPRVPANLGHPTLNVPAADELADAIFSTITHTRDEVEKARRKYEREMRKGRKVSQKFAAGDRVMLSTKFLNLQFGTKKLVCRYAGPFKVVEPPAHSTNPNVVWLDLPKSLRVHMPINIANVKPFVPRTEDLGGPQEEPPEPVIIDGQECHEVEAILAEREVRRQRQVLVKWAGYDILNAS